MNRVNRLQLLFFMIMVLFAHSADGRSEKAGQKACIANLRIFKSAVEMFEIDDRSVTELDNKDYQKVLIDEKYLKSRLQCPGPYLLIPGILWGEKLIDLPAPDRLEYRIDIKAGSRYEVLCSAHGSIEELNRSEIEHTNRY